MFYSNHDCDRYLFAPNTQSSVGGIEYLLWIAHIVSERTIKWATITILDHNVAQWHWRQAEATICCQRFSEDSWLKSQKLSNIPHFP